MTHVGDGFVLSETALQILNGREVEIKDSSDDDLSRTYQKSVTTNDAVATVIDSTTMADNTRILIIAKIVGMQEDGTEGVVFWIVAHFKRDGGGATLVGGTTSIFTENSEAAETDAEFVANGNDVETKVTGIDAEDWVWTTKQEIIILD